MTSSLTSISTLTSRKKALEAKLDDALRTSTLREDLDIEYQADTIDEMRSGVNRDVTIEQLNQQTRLGREIRSALKKLNSGGYGICEECEKPISQRRLDDPSASNVSHGRKGGSAMQTVWTMRHKSLFWPLQLGGRADQQQSRARGHGVVILHETAGLRSIIGAQIGRPAE